MGTIDHSQFAVHHTQFTIIKEPIMSAEISATLGEHKRIALVAHDHKKDDLLEWADYNKEILTQHDLYATGGAAPYLSHSTTSHPAWAMNLLRNGG
jgi:hypothetical protein